jgi:regulator of sirC expression with transglutaminase-like and TPR domain
MNLDEILEDLAADPDTAHDVAAVALLLARDEYADLDVEAYLSELDALAHEARGLIRGDLAGRVRGLCRFLFHDLGFHGNSKQYYDPRNSYLHLVLERRTGIPITLSVVAMALGARCGLDVRGVGLPGHFIVKAVEGDREILFDPFHGGRRLSPTDCEHLVQQVTGVPFQATPETLRAVPLGLLVQRMLTNLKGIYLGTGEFARAVRVLRRLCQLVPGDPLQRRDLGAALLHAGQPGKAIDALNTYLATVPDASDVAEVQQLLQQARRAVAAWN